MKAGVRRQADLRSCTLLLGPSAAYLPIATYSSLKCTLNLDFLVCRDDIVEILSQARLDVKQVEEQHGSARRAVASASTRAASAQKQKLLSGASTPGALSEARKGAGVVSMSENITASAFLFPLLASCHDAHLP